MHRLKLVAIISAAFIITLLPTLESADANDRTPEVRRWTSIDPSGGMNVLVAIPKDHPDHDRLLMEELVNSGWPGGELKTDLTGGAGPEQLDGATFGFTWCAMGQAGHVGFSTQTGPGFVVWTHNSPSGPIPQLPNYGYCDGFGGCSYVAHGNVSLNPLLAPWWVEINWQGANPYVFTEYCTWGPYI